MSNQTLTDLLQSCIVKITVLQNKQMCSTGTGFFIAPNRILTCAHVVKEAYKNNALSINLYFKNQQYSANIKDFFEDVDVCVLTTDISTHFCVYLGESMTVGDNLYAYGYPEKYPNGDSLTVEFEGKAESENKKILAKLKQGWIQPGFSGAPLLNLKTGSVCGMLKSTHDRNIDLGGRAIPITEIFPLIPELKQEQQEFHQRDKTWKKQASKIQKENENKDMTIFNQQNQKVKGNQYNTRGDVNINKNITYHSDDSPQKSYKNLYLLTGAIVAVIIIVSITIVALQPNNSNIITGDGSTGVIQTGDGSITIHKDNK